MLEIPEVPSVTDLRIEVTGEVRDDHRWCSAYFDRSWRGVAFAEEPVFALAFGTDRRGTSWVKSYPGRGNAVGVELAHGPYVAGHALYLRLYSRVWPPALRASSAEESGGHHLQLTGSGIERPDAWPPARLAGRAGCRFELLTLPGAAPVVLDLFVLPRRLLEVGRSKIWRLRPRCRDDVPEPLRHVLRYGRAGRWPPRWCPTERG